MLKDLLRRTKTAPSIALVLKAIIMACFVFGQLNSSAHAHDHEHENEPHENYCAFCILTVQDENSDVEDSDVDETDSPHISDGPAILFTQKPFFADRTNNLRPTYFTQFYLRPVGCINCYADAVRAPPFA